MYLVLNHDEVVAGLAKKIIARSLRGREPDWSTSTAYLRKMDKKFLKTGLIEINFATLNELLMQDTKSYKESLTKEYKKRYRGLISWLADRYDLLGIPNSQLTSLYLHDPAVGFVKAMSQHMTQDPVWKVAGEIIPDDQSVLIRGNAPVHHALLSHRIQSQLPFWFVDTGYTNFLTGKKTWHRLVADHIHHIPPNTYFPSDRLTTLPSLPKPWRDQGRDILVVENSDRHYKMFGTTLSAWRQGVKETLSKLTDKPIKFRPKSDDIKNRDSLYEHLTQSDYYCVITDASAAAIEAVWAGIPIITLNTHISRPVARTSLEDINDLYRGPIGDWLCALSYSQFTQREIFDGTALRLMEQYYV